MRSSIKHSLWIATLCCLGLTSGCGIAADAQQDLPEFTSLDETFEAVDAAAGCIPTEAQPVTKVLTPPGPTGEATLCTNAVEVLWFDDPEVQENVHELMASAAGPAGNVYFVEGKNWFVVDYSEVQQGGPGPEKDLDFEKLAEELGANYEVAD